MRSKLKLIERFSGPKASVYSILEETAVGISSELMFDRFIKRYRKDFEVELLDIARRLHSLGNKTGCLDVFFKMDEGLEVDDMVCALYDVPDKHLRLFCIRPSEQMVIIGDGGPKTTRTWQEDAQLTKSVGDMMQVSQILRAKMNNRDTWVSTSGLYLEGDLYISKT